MRHAWVVASREVPERRAILLAALVAGLLPFASPLFPGVRAERWAEARDGAALLIACLFGVGCALLLGASAVGRDLAEGRLGFDFAKPLGTGAIWGGRFLGALALTLLASVLAVFPATLVGGGLLSREFQDVLAQGALAFLGAVLLLIPLAHAASVAFRSRSGWLGIDLAGAVVVLLVCGAASQWLYRAFAPRLLGASLLALAGIAIPALWAASAVQLRVGRTDPKLGHRAMSTTLWAALLLTALAFFGFARWVVRATPADLAHAWSVSASSGEWIALAGPARWRGDFQPAFLVDATSGRFLRLGAAGPVFHGVRFSADGRRAAWARFDGPSDSRPQIAVAELDSTPPRTRGTPIVLSSPWSRFAISADGARIAVLQDAILSVLDLASGDVLASVRVEEQDVVDHALAIDFVTRDRVRLYRFEPALEILDLDVPQRRLERIAPPLGSTGFASIEWSAGHERVLISRYSSERGAWLLDGRTGALLADLASTGGAQVRTPRLLADGRIVAVEHGPPAATLRVHTIDGAVASEIRLDSADLVLLGGEIEPGRVAVTLASRGAVFDGSSRTLVVDVKTGRSEDLATGLIPIAAFGSPGGQGPVAPGGVRTRLFTRGESLVLVDPGTRAKRIVAGPALPAS